MTTKLKLNILWLETKLGIAIDQLQSNNQIPLTKYFFWPSNNAWDQIRSELETKSWISDYEKTCLLNTIVSVMNEWQNLESEKTNN